VLNVCVLQGVIADYVSSEPPMIPALVVRTLYLCIVYYFLLLFAAGNV